ncbi:sugar isomerase [Thiospirochaeta perfilievii]|uniref:Glutamine--fructose-6-phosphate aminotransferase [isomerizing] n=1 Tax=Thiospirochaeta perfilievii TaxID=252967 RepID=A0A5C1QD95_9SPIO|nr:SIS domain-containing protein [Thiospirochaeta perfilievii]QEN05040.1 sugar isomerase [Thiospirochaeta perfilievii]
MNLTDKKYSQYSLTKEMLETVEVMRNFDVNIGKKYSADIKAKKGIFYTGEGSSRLFPGKRAIYETMKDSGHKPSATDGATQALEYDLSDYAVIGLSNSGKTKELVRLYHKLTKDNHNAFFGITAFDNTPVADLPKQSTVLSCGPEMAVAATKSVIEQALVVDSIVHAVNDKEMPSLEVAANAVETVLTQEIDPELINKIANAGTIYFAGRNNGVAEELTLKTNEITRKKSDYLEGTYAAHGIEEVQNKEDVIIVIDPFEAEEEKFKECLVDGVGLTIIAISTRDTIFPTIKIPKVDHYQNYVELAAGWNLLVDTGIKLGIEIDKPVRARKVGNEFIPE